MRCRKCGSSNVNVQAVASVETKHHSVVWWLFIGWWWMMIKWLFFFLPALIIKLIRGKRTKSVVSSHAVCQDCGYRMGL